MFHITVFDTSSKLVPAGYQSFTVLNVSFLNGNGINRDDQITSCLTAVCHSGHISNYLSAAGTAVQFTSTQASSPSTNMSPTLTKYHLATYHTAIITVEMSRGTKVNCCRKSGLYHNSDITGHNALKCLQTSLSVIFWGVERESIVIFKLQKRVIQIMCGVGRDTSCRQLFKDCKILTITSLYILEVLCFIQKHKLAIQKNEQVHDH